MKVTLSNWISNAINLNSQDKFSFEGRVWMPHLFDTKATRRIWKMSRQVGKSTGGAAESISRSCLIDNFRTLYVSPQQDHAKKFSADRLDPMIHQSPIIKSQLGKVDNKFEKDFRKGGKIYLKYAKYDADSCRGITADMVHFDEVQDQELENTEAVIVESLFTSKYKLRLYTGTPKSFENPIHKRWEQSDQREWLVPCSGCKKYNRLGIANIGKTGPICSKCGKKLDVNAGQWVRHRLDSNIAGFHVHQMHCKISHETEEAWGEIIHKFENYSRHEFLNEVLGESSDSAVVPITEEMLKAISSKEIDNSLKPKPKFMSSPTMMGLDWGHGEAATVIVIGNMGPDGVFRNLFMKKYKGAQCQPDYCIPDITKIAKKFQVQRIHADRGGGFSMNGILAKNFKKGMVTSNLWSDSARSKDSTWTTKDLEVPRLTLNRSKAMADYINKMQRRKIIFPTWSQFHPEFSSDFLGIRKEMRKDDSVRYIRTCPDDAFHASIYCYIIARAHYSSMF